MQTLRKFLTSLSLSLLVLGPVGANAEEAIDAPIKSNPGPIDKVANAIKRGASAAATGIEKGARAAAGGIERGTKAAANGIEHGAQATARGVERGASATGRAAHKVADKIGGSDSSSSSSQPALSAPAIDK
nr:hypothetical protein [Rhodoferax sp.]